MKSQANSISWLSLVNLGFALLGVAQALVVGRIFGISSAIEIYFAAAVIYQSVVKLTQTGQILEIFTPLYHEIRTNDGLAAAHRFTAAFTNWLIIIVLPVSALIWLIAPFVVPFIVPGFNENQLDETIAMFRWIIPLLAIKVLERAFASYLNAEKYFLAPELARLICVAGGIGIILTLAQKIDAWAMIVALWVSVGGTLIAEIFYAAKKGYRHSFRLREQNFKVSKFLNRAPSLLTYVSCTQLFTITLTAALSLLPSGSLAIYTYANKLFAVARRIAQRPLSVVFLNHYSSAISDRPSSGQVLTLDAFKISLVLNTLLSALFISSGSIFIDVVWESPEFPRAQTYTTYLLSTALFLSLFLSTPALIYRKINISHQCISPQYLVAGLVQIINAIMAYFIIPSFHLPGVIFVLIASSLLTMLSNAALLKALNPLAFSFYDLKELFGCVSVMALSVTPIIAYRILQTEGENLGEPFLGTKMSQLVDATAIGILTLFLVFIFSYILRVKILSGFFRMLLNRLSKYKAKAKPA